MLLAVWDDGLSSDLVRIAIIGAVAYILVLWVAALVWTYRDIAARTRDTLTQTISLVLVLVFNLPGLLLYLVLRPKDTMADSFDRQLEAEALLHEIQEQATCPTCRRRISDDFVSCPYCRTQLRQPCDSCGKPLSAAWVLCPFCGRDKPLPAPPGEGRVPVVMRSQAASSVAAVADAATTELPRTKRASTATYTPPAAAKVAATPPEALDADSGS